MRWVELQIILNNIKEEHSKHAKRAIKLNVPKGQETRKDIVTNLVTKFNEFVRITNSVWERLDDDQRNWVKDIFNKVRDKTLISFAKLGVDQKIPVDPTTELNIGFIKSEDTYDTMALTAIEFINLADKILPKSFDGNIGGLTSFIDAIQLLKGSCNDNEVTALNFIKTRLTGKARLAIQDNISTLDQVIVALKQKCKGDNSQLLEAKLLSTKQLSKDAITYAKEIEDLALGLTAAYISEGVREDTAESFAKNKAIKTIITNASNEKTRFIMEAGNFQTLQDATSKFLSVDTESISSNTNVFYNRGYRGTNHDNRYERRRNFSRIDNQNFNNNRSGNGHYNRFHNNRGRSIRRNPNGSAHIRTYESGNETPTHSLVMGGESFSQQ